MPLFYQQNINSNTRLAIWKIEETEFFFTQSVSIQREITHPHKRLQHLAGRYLLKFLFPDFPNEEILIANTRKPYLPYEQYHFSISHCGDFAAAIVSKTERVGIDIEIPTPKVLKIRNKFLSENEIANIQHSILNIQLHTLLWSCKEAMYKWWGWGEVDFKKMLQLQFESIHNEGIIHAKFLHHNIKENLQLDYKLFENLCVAWVCSNGG
ncbi:MAG: 4'-phosphopantetheinyl transferase superfamily protein [Bacteroidetes bacterium]|nr:4'-phosphopantetheinyl transferase superfamily protein [Bacteroidota bacterium]MBS1650352.1 4'-phosphopantetheinyl transferase superfamily protein [Bacteroidota bacterium]